MHYHVSVEAKDAYYPLYSKSFTDKDLAIEQAKYWAKQFPEHLVFIEFRRASDGQVGYINPNGADITGRSWTIVLD